MADRIPIDKAKAAYVVERASSGGTFRIGETVQPFVDLHSVSYAYLDFIDQHLLGVSSTPTCTIHDATGQEIAYVSYNGRVWAGADTDRLLIEEGAPHDRPNLKAEMLSRFAD